MTDDPRFNEVAVDRREETVTTAQPGYTTTEHRCATWRPSSG